MGSRTASRSATGKKGDRPVGGGGLGVATRLQGAAATDAAFSKSFGSKDNFVTLAEFRKNFGGSREEQDKAIREGRLAGKYTLDSHEGLSPRAKDAKRQGLTGAEYDRVARGGLSDSELAAAIHEGGSRYIYISKR